MGYLSLIIITLVLGLGTQAWIKANYRKWTKVPSNSRMTGAQAARMMLDANGLNHVSIQMIQGELSDHFDPRTNVVSLSSGVYQGATVGAVAVACHECGHAVQHAKRYAPASIRAAIVPVVNLASNAWVFVLFAGLFLQMIGLVYIAVALYVAVIAFQLVTLPVEFDASKRALGYISNSGVLSRDEHKGAASVLRAAAMTYVAAALSSLLYLIYILGFARD